MRGWSATPTETGLQLSGQDMTPADAFMMHEYLGELIEGKVERREDGKIHELVSRTTNWAWTPLP